MRLGWTGIIGMLLCVACGNVERNPANEPGATTASGASGGTSSMTSGVSSTAGGAAAGGGSAAAASDVPQPLLDDVPIACEACEAYKSFALLFSDNGVRKLAWAGERLLVVRETSNIHHVDLLELEPAVRASWSEQVGSSSNVHLLEDQGQAVVVDSTREDRLEVFAEGHEFRMISSEVGVRTAPMRVISGELHVLSTDTDGVILHQRGPLAGPFETVERFGTPVLIPPEGPLVPIEIERQADAQGLGLAVLLSTELNGRTLERELPWAAEVSALVASDDLIVLWQTRLVSAELSWTDGARQLGNSMPAPSENRCAGSLTTHDICPGSATDLGERSRVPLAAHFFLDDSGQAWVAYILADLRERCEWTTINGCFETLPCECATRIVTESISNELIVERVTEPNSSVHIKLPTFQGPPNLVQLAARAAGDLVSVAVADVDSLFSELYVVRFLVPS